MKTKPIRQFIREHRAELDSVITAALTRYDPPGFDREIQRLNDGEREDWVMNDEGLYNWARSEGVRI
jgi:hypothetical protein